MAASMKLICRMVPDPRGDSCRRRRRAEAAAARKEAKIERKRKETAPAGATVRDACN